MTSPRGATTGFIASVLTSCMLVSALAAPAPDLPDLQQQVHQTEQAFARSMAQRDLNAFGQFVATEAVFFQSTQVLRGKPAVLAAWQAYFTGPQAPFSWEPDQVEVLASGTLATSSGPVRDAQGRLIARFHSVWRLEAPGLWRIVFDRGQSVCPCESASP
jgi:ketosteroid isomerase-like protein